MTVVAVPSEESRDHVGAGLIVRPRLLAGLALTVAWANLATNWQVVTALMAGSREVLDATRDGRIRLAREAVVALLAVLLVNAAAEHKRREHGGFDASPAAVLLGVLLAFEAARTVLSGDPPELVVIGLRAVPLLLIAACLPHYSPAALGEVLDRVARGVRWFLLAQAALVVYQVTSTPQTFGRTFAGSRAYGSFPAPNNLGMAVIAVMVLLVARKPRGWRVLAWLCVALAVTTGSRTALLGVLLVAASGPASRLPAKALLAYPAGLLLAGLGLVFSGSTFSGRQISGEGRFDQWLRLVDQAHGPMDWLFGLGVGAGSNAAATTGQDVTGVSDSTLVATFLSFGALGVAALVAGVVKVATRGDGPLNLRYLPAVLLAGMSFNVPEISPLNIVAVLFIGAAMPRCGGSGGAGSLLPPRAVERERHQQPLPRRRRDRVRPGERVLPTPGDGAHGADGVVVDGQGEPHPR